MFSIDPGYDPEDTRSVDVGIASDQYLRWYNHPVIASDRNAEQKATGERVSRIREAAVLAGLFAALFALERIFGKKLQSKSAASSSAITTAARAAAV